jgi:rhodanese-related sulfurtransferase
MNYALQARTSEEFIHLLTDSLPPRPEYFGRSVELNRQGAGAIEQLPRPKPVSAPDVYRLQSEGAIVLDTRPLQQFAVAHVPGSVHVALSGQYASWAARILGLDRHIILVGEDADHLRESQLRLARVGMEQVDTYLEGGIQGWLLGGYQLEYIPQVTVEEFDELRRREPVNILDVREAGEVAAGAIEGSQHIPLGQLPSRIAEVLRDKLLVVHCKGGYRSSIATSLLRRAGIVDLANLTWRLRCVDSGTGAAGSGKHFLAFDSATARHSFRRLGYARLDGGAKGRLRVLGDLKEYGLDGAVRIAIRDMEEVLLASRFEQANRRGGQKAEMVGDIFRVIETGDRCIRNSDFGVGSSKDQVVCGCEIDLADGIGWNALRAATHVAHVGAFDPIEGSKGWKREGEHQEYRS